jgi:triosephosphate isomerase
MTEPGRRIVAGNWKMHHGPAATREFIAAFRPHFDPDRVDVLLFPPALSLPEARNELGGDSRISLGIQHIHSSTSGAFTGEISAEMAVEVGASFALIGHSERRQLFHETDLGTRERVVAAYRAGLSPLLCVGETITERKGGLLEEVLLRQLDAVLSTEEVRNAIRAGSPFSVAYEPVWAIGTGETATPADASEAHAILRKRLGHHLGELHSSGVPILYGGSVNSGNAGELMTSPGVDGVLVGGASLKPDSLAAIVESA